MPYTENGSKPDFPYKGLATKNSSDVMGAALDGDIYNYPRRLEKHRQALAKMRNGQLTLAFLDHLLVLGLSIARVSKYAAHLRTLLRIIDYKPREATKQDVEKIVAWIQKENYADWTRHDLKLILKKLIQYAKNGSCDKNTPVPAEVAWIPLNTKQQESVSAEDLLTVEDVVNILKNTRNLRDHAMLITLFEGALRITELLTMRVRSVEFRNDYCLLSVNGKTGFRRVTVVAAYRPLLDWLQQHPYRNDSNAPLWVSLSTNGNKRPFHYASFRELVKNTAKRAGIEKRVWGYLFRHSQLTLLAKKLTESQLKGIAGWRQDSKMAAKYVHLSGRDNEDAILSIHEMNGADKQKENGIMKSIACPNCGEKNTPATIRCISCGLILDQKAAIELTGEREGKVDELFNRVEKLENILREILEPKAVA